MASEYQPPSAPPGQKKKSGAMPWIIGGCAVLLLGAIILCIGGYAFYRWRSARATDEDASGESPSSGSTEGTKPPGAGTSPAGSDSANSNRSPAERTGEGTPTTWEATAASLTGDVGKTFTLTCSPNGTMHAVWGSDIYTADSSICTAAVHAGLITLEKGGTVTIELRAGRQVYGSSQRNGVTTASYGGYPRSFVFKTGTNESEVKEAEEVTPILWNTPAFILTQEVGKTHKFKCAAEGTGHAIWGTDVYTADSSICTAAVHAGVINFAGGGTVTIELRPGQSAYQGTTRNGVKSNEYGAYQRSFVVR